MKRFFLVLFIAGFSVNSLWAQSLAKEAMNNFAGYSKTQDIAKLEKARKQIDDLYTTKRDSFIYKNNLIRALVYSTLAAIDSSRKYTYKKDPIVETEFSVARINNPKFLTEHEGELAFVRKQLSKAYLLRANKSLLETRYYEALNGFKKVDSLNPGDASVTHNLAVLSNRLGFKEDAIRYYDFLIGEKSAHPDYFLILADLYLDQNDDSKMLETLQHGHKKFPGNRDILFKLLNIYSGRQDYPAILSIIGAALDLEGDNTSLTYLAGFSSEMVGNNAAAERYYKKTLSIDPNHYDGNYELGLLYLNSYLRNTKKEEMMFLARQYLSKANEINPNDVKLLRALVILYKEMGDMIQLQKINNKLNELILN